MNTTSKPFGSPVRCGWQMWSNLGLSLLVAAATTAQVASAQTPPNQPLTTAKDVPAKAWRSPVAGGLTYYGMKFDGGTVRHLEDVWKSVFTNDNFIVTSSAKEVPVPAFEIRNVTLAELARSIAFLSQGILDPLGCRSVALLQL